MKPAAFTYHRARDAHGAAALLAELGDEAKLIAGGQSLVPMMNFRLARPQHLVDIGGLRELRYIRPAGTGLRLGALTTHRAVETASPDVLGPGFAVLRRAMGWIGHIPIRCRGTVGGSFAHGDATAEWCLLAVLLGAEIVVQGPGRAAPRVIPADEMFLGFFTTAVAPDEVIVEVRFPRPAPHAALTEFAERRGDFATVAAAVSLDLVDGELRGGTVALGGVAPAPCRVPEAETVLAAGGRPRPELFQECAAAAAAAVDPPDDAHGSSHYRRLLIRKLVVQACEEALNQ
ncbi:MAG: 6-hydroxypseudooxynicotine dehydrogenase subunit alpha [Streptomyces sp.]|nr:6-hydroxypseudooxynicotine dehydrogenase subunit alpha [Streptomyces sp.]